MKLIVITIVVGALITVTKGFGQKLEDEWRPSKQKHCWHWPEYWWESRRLEETCCYNHYSEKPSANAGVKNSQKRNNNNKIWDRREHNTKTKWINKGSKNVLRQKCTLIHAEQHSKMYDDGIY